MNTDEPPQAPLPTKTSASMPATPDESPAQENAALTYLYKEYERRHALINTYSQSYFDDFKLLGALGLVFAWEPIASSLKQGQHVPDDILLIGFIATLAISAVISLHEIMKQSLILYNHRQLACYEVQLRQHARLEETGTFRDSENWHEWFHQRHRYLAQIYFLAYWSILIGFSVSMLVRYTTGYTYACYYLIAAAVALFTSIWAGAILYKKE